MKRLAVTIGLLSLIACKEKAEDKPTILNENYQKAAEVFKDPERIALTASCNDISKLFQAAIVPGDNALARQKRQQEVFSNIGARKFTWKMTFVDLIRYPYQKAIAAIFDCKSLGTFQLYLTVPEAESDKLIRFKNGEEYEVSGLIYEYRTPNDYGIAVSAAMLP